MQNEEELKQILAGLQEQQRPVSIFQRIAEAVARGIGTAASPSPGNALLEQVKEKGAERQRKQDRESDIRRVGVQFQLQDLANRLSERREIAKEKRVEDATVRAEDRAEDRAESEYYRSLGGQIQLRNIDQRDKKELFTLDLLGRKQLQQMSSTSAELLAKLQGDIDLKNREKATEFQTIFNLTLSGAMTGEEAGNLLRKVKADDPDDPITPKERKLLQKARRQLENEDTMNKIRVAVANNQGGSADKFEQQLLQGMLVGARTSEEGLFRDGQGAVKLLPITRGIGGIIQAPEGMSFVREATLAEKTQKVLDDFKQVFPVLKGDRFNSLEGNRTGLVNNFMDQVQAAKDRKIPIDVIIKGLQADAEKNPQMKEVIDIVLSKLQTEKPVEQAKQKFDEAKTKKDTAENRANETPQDFEKRVKKIKAEKQVQDLEKTEERAKTRLKNLKEGGTADPRIIKKAEEDASDAQARLSYARSQLAKMD